MLLETNSRVKDGLFSLESKLQELQEAVLINALIEQSEHTELSQDNARVISLLRWKLSLDMQSSLSCVMDMVEELGECLRGEERSEPIQSIS